MQLTYRGIAYVFVPPAPASCQRQAVRVRYRGLAWDWPAQSASVALPQSFALTYRGLALNPVAKTASRAPATISPHMETHRQNLLRRLQERIRSAQARGDEHLLQQLEQERQLLA